MKTSSERRDVEVKAEEVKVEEAKKPRRRKRVFENLGPLGGVPKLDGYRLYWAMDGDERKPDRVQRLTHMDDYDFVTPSELGLLDHEGKPLTGGTVTRSAGNGKTYYLLKKPIDYHTADVEEKVRRNMKGVHDIAKEKTLDTGNGDISEFSSLKINEK